MVGQIAGNCIINRRDNWIQLKNILSGNSSPITSTPFTTNIKSSQSTIEDPPPFPPKLSQLPHEEELEQLIFRGNKDVEMSYAVKCIHKLCDISLPDSRFLVSKLGSKGKLKLDSWKLFVSHFTPLEKERMEPVVSGYYQNPEGSHYYNDAGPMKNKPHQNCLSYAIRLLHEPWFRWPSSDKNTCESKILGSPAGTFVVRFSNREHGKYAIAVSDGTQNKAWKIYCEKGKFYLNHEELFDSLYELISYYEKKQISNGVALLIVPTLKEKPSLWVEKKYTIPNNLLESTFLKDNDGYQSLTMTPDDKLGFDNLWSLVVNLWNQTMPETSIISIDVIINTVFQTAFENRIEQFMSRKSNPAFQPDLQNDLLLNRRQEVLQRMEKYVLELEVDSSVKIALLFHGTQKAHEICQSGFSALALTDEGFFGRGLYSTPQAEYATRVYSKHGGSCLACFVSTLNPFPVLNEDEVNLKGRTNVPRYDSHFVPVVPKNPDKQNEKVYYATKEGEIPTYDEFVVFQESQILPRFVINFSNV